MTLHKNVWIWSLVVLCLASLASYAQSPAITQQPQGVSAMPGSSATFTVVATGQTPLNYQWLFNGASMTNSLRVSGVLTSTLTISNLVAADGGSYSVVVYNKHGTVTSSNALLQVGPSITSQPSSRTNLVGSAALFAASASGTAPLAYQWFFNGSPLADGGRTSGARTSALTVSSVQTNDAGLYWLAVSNPAGTATSLVASLTVLVPPAIVQQPASQIVQAGAGFTLSAVANGTTPLAYQWFFNTSPLADGGRISGATTTALTILNSQTNDSGSYYVTVSNVVGTATSSNAVVNMVLPPTISAIPNQRTFPNLSTRTIAFTIGDAQTPASALVLSAASSNPSLVPDANAVFGGSGSNRTVQVTPAGGSKGTAAITINVQNSYGVSAATTFNVTVADFSDIHANLLPTDGGSAAWGDYDGDGRLDLLITGSQTTKVYHNDGNGVFRDVGANLLGIIYGGAVWGDYNNDGRLDILLSGSASGNSELDWRIYRNDGASVFTLVSSPFTTGYSGAYTHFVGLGWGDYDNDGRLDALFVGWPGSTLFRNAGNDTFTNSGLSLPGGGYSSGTAWGDFDNDGNPDFVLSEGWYPDTELFHNLGGGVFSDSTTALPPIFQAMMAAEDFNNDGNLDLAMTGTDTNHGQVTWLFAGDGHGGFANVPVNMPGTYFGSIAWGDFDNDGLPDLVVSWQGATSIYRNNGDGTFSDLGISLPGVYDGGIAVGDFDNDGALDIAIVGSSTSGLIAKVFHNDGAMPNTPPSPPSVLSANPSSNSVTLNWAAASDAEQTGGLSYNVRMGTTPGGSDIVGPMADAASGLRRLPALGNAGLALARTITGLHANTYYWSVQAIDHAFAGSAFAPEKSFTLSAPMFTTQPLSQTNPAGANASFTASASGTGPIAYQWYLNGAPLVDTSRIIGSTTTSLSITNLQLSDAGNYTVVASDLAGSATSSVAVLVVIAPPAITTQPVGRSVPAGLRTAFVAAATGTPPLSYQWQLNGSDIPGATNASLTILSVTASNLGAYHVVVTNLAGQATSTDALLTFGPVAAWGRNTEGQALPPPGLSNVIAIAAGFSSSIALRADGTVIAWGQGPGTNLPPALSNIVAISAGSSDSCLALRSDGSVITWNLFPLVPPTLSNVVAIAAGWFYGLAQRAEGTVTGWGSQGTANIPPPASIVPPGLTKVGAVAAGVNQSLVLHTNGSVVGFGTGIATNLPLSLTNADAVASGYSHGLALRADGTVLAWGSTSATNVPAGLTNVATIVAGGYPQGNGQSLAIRSNGLVVAWGDNTYAESVVPTGLSNVVAAACGAYHALAVVGDGSPLIMRPPAGGTFFTGRDLRLQATVAGSAPLSYQWLLNGTNLPGATNASLLIASAQAANSGNYQIVASNALGVATSVTATVTIIDGGPSFLVPPPATNRAYLGQNFTLPEAVVGSGPLQFQWQFNGQNISGATGDELPFRPARNTNAGPYTVVVANSFGAITSSVVSLRIISVVGWGAYDIAYGETNVPLNASNVVAISAGSSESMVLRADGTALAWGSAIYAQTNIPPTLSNIVEVAAGNLYNLALKADGTVVGFGSIASNTFAGLSNIVALEADNGGSTFLRMDGTIVRLTGSTWSYPPSGTNGIALAHNFSSSTYGLLRADGLVLLGNSTYPVSGVGNVVAMALGPPGMLFVHTNGLQEVGSYAPPLSASNAVDVAANYANLLALRPDGSLAQWVGSVTNPPPGLTNVAVVDGGTYHFLAMLTERPFPAVLLPTALNTPALVVSSKSSPQWFGQTNISHDGVAAAQSAAIDRNTQSSMRTLIVGPVTARFWWKVSSETNHDFLSFSISGVPQAAISGETDWQQRSFNIPAGRQMLMWTYSKDAGGTAGQDTAWVDQLELLPQPPTILTQPLSQTVLGASNVTFSVSANGTPPLNYIWMQNGGSLLSGSTVSSGNTSFLVLFNATRANSAAYSVLVTNAAGGALSSNAVLIVHVPQHLTATPQPGGALLLGSADADGGSLAGASLSNFTAQASSNLVNWVPLPGALIPTNGAFLLRDTNSSNPRFYRILEAW